MGDFSGSGWAKRLSLPLLGASILVLQVASARADETGAGGLFVLPVERTWPVNASAAAVFDERLSIAIAETRRARPLGARDVPEAQRSTLPKELSACVTPACLKRLTELTGAERVLGTKLADDGGGPTLFASVYDARTGAVVQRREWPGRPDEPPVSGRLAGEVARWAVGPAPQARAADPPPAVRALAIPPSPGVVALALAPGEPAASQANALLDQLATELGRRGPFSMLSRGGGLPRGGGAPPSQRATVQVEQAHVSLRAHHAHHVREGALAAVMTIVDVPGGTALFSARGHAERSIDSKKVSDAEVMSQLVDDVVAQWMQAFDAQSVAGKLTKKGSP
jgi:hypothetical protein